MPKIMSFICQKGGTGKSTLTKLAAAYFNDRRVSCVVIDSDYPQFSLYNQRAKDLWDLSTDGLKLPSPEELQAKEIFPYPIYHSNMETSAIRLTALKTRKEEKLILVDLPGTLNVEGISNVVKHLDLAIVPCELETMSIKAGMDTISFLLERRTDLPIYVLWSRLDKSHSVTTRQNIETFIKNKFPSIGFTTSMAYKSRDYRDVSTLSPAPETFYDLMNEIISFLNSGHVKSGSPISQPKNV